MAQAGVRSARGLAPSPLTFFSGTQVWSLKVIACFFVGPFLLALLRGAFSDTAALAAAMALLLLGANFVGRGLTVEVEAQGGGRRSRAIPWKLLGAVATGGAAGLVSLGAAHDGGAMALLFAALAGGACAFAYGVEASFGDGRLAAAARRAGLRPAEVAATLAEAETKLHGIETAAAGLQSLELKERLSRICASAQAVLGHVEREPRDLGKVRRFLVTYLDGTRDVVEAYARQQRDVAATPLAQNFRRVLGTIEEVFAEQERLLRQHARLDLEVRIEVLETQLRHEGVR